MDILNKNSYQSIKQLAENYAKKSLGEGTIYNINATLLGNDTTTIINGFKNVYVGQIILTPASDCQNQFLRLMDYDTLDILVPAYGFGVNGNVDIILLPLVVFSGLTNNIVDISAGLGFLQFNGYVFGNV